MLPVAAPLRRGKLGRRLVARQLHPGARSLSRELDLTLATQTAIVRVVCVLVIMHGTDGGRTCLANARTVLGDVPAEQLGFTLPHEHIVVSYAAARYEAEHYDAQALADEACRELEPAVRAYGIRTIVDAGPSDLGRDVQMQREVSRRLGAHVIAATGFYKADGGIPFFWRYAELDEIEGHLVSEIEKGVGMERVRCGVIKVASSGATITPVEEKVFRAAARASKRTGAPIITHTDRAAWADTNVGLAQLGLLLSEGLDPSRVMIGHACGSADVAQLLAIAQLGGSVGIDRVGSQRVISDASRVEMVKRLSEAGYVRQVMLSMDHEAVWFPHRLAVIAAEGKHYSHLHQMFLPKLRMAGVSDADVEQMTVGNPRGFLTLDP